MGLFTKRTETGLHAPLYSLTAEKTVLVVGLGNPGKKYDCTRHNVGFECIDAFVKHHDFPAWQEKKSLKCLISTSTIVNCRVVLIKPTTFMNNSGEALQAVQRFFKITNEQTVVIHDELDVDFGSIRSRVGGGTAGHNGVKSLVEQGSEDFGRIRVGVGPKKPASIDSADFVLQPFSKEQQKSLTALTNEVSVILSEYLASGHLPHDTRTFV